MKKISQQSFEELKISGHCVPRYEETGKIIPFKVGKKYTISDGKEKIKVKCTQDCPYHLIKIE